MIDLDSTDVEKWIVVVTMPTVDDMECIKLYDKDYPIDKSLSFKGFAFGIGTPKGSIPDIFEVSKLELKFKLAYYIVNYKEIEQLKIDPDYKMTVYYLARGKDDKEIKVMCGLLDKEGRISNEEEYETRQRI